MQKAVFTLGAVLCAAAFAGQAAAATCRNTGNFDKWLADFKKEALAQGISPSVLAAASPYLQFEQRIINRDRAQGVFNQSFLKFSDRMNAAYRMQTGQQQMKSHAALFARVEKEFGVPAPILTAFWGLESDFGKNTGKSNVFVAITTLAYDCRRPDYFRPQLFDALRIAQRGDLTIDEMQGGDWAGELGAMQFTASDYYKYAVDYDGDGLVGEGREVAVLLVIDRRHGAMIGRPPVRRQSPGLRRGSRRSPGHVVPKSQSPSGTTKLKFQWRMSTGSWCTRW